MSVAIAIKPACFEELETLVGLPESRFSGEETRGFDAAGQRRGLEYMLNNGRGRILAVRSVGGTVADKCAAQLAILTAADGPAVLAAEAPSREDRRDQGMGQPQAGTIGGRSVSVSRSLSVSAIVSMTVTH